MFSYHQIEIISSSIVVFGIFLAFVLYKFKKIKFQSVYYILICVFTIKTLSSLPVNYIIIDDVYYKKINYMDYFFKALLAINTKTLIFGSILILFLISLYILNKLEKISDEAYSLILVGIFIFLMFFDLINSAFKIL